MEDIAAVFALASSGMEYQKARLEAAAYNVANIGVSRPYDQAVLQALRVVPGASGAVSSSGFSARLTTAPAPQFQAQFQAPRLIDDPSHPHAGQDGFVRTPRIDPLQEAVSVMSAVRLYEANLRVLEASQKMARKTIEWGRGA